MSVPQKGAGLPANPLPSDDGEPEDSQPRGLPAYHYTPPKVTQNTDTTPGTGSSNKTEYSEITQMILDLEGRGPPRTPSPSAPRIGVLTRAAAAVQQVDQEEEQANTTVSAQAGPPNQVVNPDGRNGNNAAVGGSPSTRSGPPQESGVQHPAKQDVLNAANNPIGFRQQQNASTPLGRTLSPRAPTPSPITPHHMSFINVQPAPLPDNAAIASHDDPNGALARRLQTYQSFSTAGDFLAENIHPVDEALIAPPIHDRYVIKTVATIKCDECGVKLVGGWELYQCQTCSSQICQQCVEERLLQEETANAARAAPGRGRAGLRKDSGGSVVSHISAAAEGDLDAEDVQDDTVLTNASVETGYTDISATTGAKNDGMRPGYKFDWQGRRKHIPFKLCYLDRRNKVPANRGPWEYDVVAPDYADNLVPVRVRLLADTRSGKGGKAKKGKHTRTFPGRRAVSEGADTVVSGRVKKKKKKKLVTDHASPTTVESDTANTMKAVLGGRPGTLNKLQRIQEMARTAEQALAPAGRADRNDLGDGDVRQGNGGIGRPTDAPAVGGGAQQQHVPAAPAWAPGLYAGFAPQEEVDADSYELYGEVVEGDLDQEFELTEEGRRAFGAGHGFDIDEGVEGTERFDQLASVAVQRLGEEFGQTAQRQQVASGEGENFEFVTHSQQQVPYHRQSATPITPQVPQLPRRIPYTGSPVTGSVPNTIHHRLNEADPNTPARRSANAHPTPETNNNQPRPGNLRGNEATHIRQIAPPVLLPYIPLPGFPYGPQNVHPGVYLHETDFLPPFSSSTFIEQPPHASGQGISTEIPRAYLEFVEFIMANPDPNKTPPRRRAREILREAQGARDEWESIYREPRNWDIAPLLGIDDRPGALSRAVEALTEARRLERLQNPNAVPNWPPGTLYSDMLGYNAPAPAPAAPRNVVRFANPGDHRATLPTTSEPIVIDSDDDEDEPEEHVPLNVVRRANPRPSRARSVARPARAMGSMGPPPSRSVAAGPAARSVVPAHRAAAAGRTQQIQTPQMRFLGERLQPGYLDGELTSNYNAPLNFAGGPIRYAYQGGYLAPWGHNEGNVVGAYNEAGRFVRFPENAAPEVAGVRRGVAVGAVGAAGGRLGGSAAVGSAAVPGAAVRSAGAGAGVRSAGAGAGVRSAGVGPAVRSGAVAVAPAPPAVAAPDFSRLNVLASVAVAVAAADEARAAAAAAVRPVPVPGPLPVPAPVPLPVPAPVPAPVTAPAPAPAIVQTDRERLDILAAAAAFVAAADEEAAAAGVAGVLPGSGSSRGDTVILGGEEEESEEEGEEGEEGEEEESEWEEEGAGLA